MGHTKAVLLVTLVLIQSHSTANPYLTGRDTIAVLASGVT